MTNNAAFAEHQAGKLCQEAHIIRLHTLCLALAVIVGGLTGRPAHAGCRLSPAPQKVPDAAQATKEDMLAAMRTLKTYDTDVVNYCKCLKFEVKQDRLPRDEQVRQHNAAIDGLKAIAEQFNEQLRRFKAKSG